MHTNRHLSYTEVETRIDSALGLFQYHAEVTKIGRPYTEIETRIDSAPGLFQCLYMPR